MIDQGDDLSSGESKNPGLVMDLLDKEAWRFGWERRLTTLTVGLIFMFYVALLGFIFIGNFRVSAGADYFFVSLKPHTTADIPVIVALSTVPTLLLIALLRYFHHRPKTDSDDSQTQIPISLEAAKELIKATSDALKPGGS